MLKLPAFLFSSLALAAAIPVTALALDLPSGYDEAGWFYRSDQISFARFGVPAIWFKSGGDFIGREPGWGDQQFADWITYKYHMPGDEVEESWNLEGLTEDARLGFRLAAAIAHADETPGWYAGDEFEAVREAALKSLDN